MKRENLETDWHTGRMSYEDEGRNQGDASRSQETPKFVGSWETRVGQIPPHSHQKEPILPTP